MVSELPALAAEIPNSTARVEPRELVAGIGPCGWTFSSPNSTRYAFAPIYKQLHDFELGDAFDCKLLSSIELARMVEFLIAESYSVEQLFCLVELLACRHQLLRLSYHCRIHSNSFLEPGEHVVAISIVTVATHHCDRCCRNLFDDHLRDFDISDKVSHHDFDKVPPNDLQHIRKSGSEPIERPVIKLSVFFEIIDLIPCVVV